MKILVTGGAGFVGAFLIKRLLDQGEEVVCVDNFNGYYEPQIKDDRLKQVVGKVKTYKLDIADKAALTKVFEKEKFDKVCHLAARAGVRPSIDNPGIYAETNVQGTLNILELMRDFGIKDLVFTSSSSVYGDSDNVPYAEKNPVDNPISPYAATKKAAELLCYTFHHLYQMRITCLRLFTVYGPWGRPDMAYFKFAKLIFSEEPIKIYGHGKMKRDFTFVDDIVEGIMAAFERPFGYEIINLGNNKPEGLLDFVKTLEKSLGVEARKEMVPMQPGDVVQTWADINKAEKLLDYSPKIKINEGLRRFAGWYCQYFTERQKGLQSEKAVVYN